MTQLDPAADPRPIKALIAAFFAAVNAANTRALAALFSPDATLSIIRQEPALVPDEDAPPDENRAHEVLRTDIMTFVRLVDEAEERRRRSGRRAPAIVETPDLGRTRVLGDAGVAAAWAPFDVTFDGVLHHYGTMVYTLVRVEDGGPWRVHSLTQSYRRTPEGDQASGGEMFIM